MNFNIEMRKRQLENLGQFISSSEDEIQSVLNSFKWKAKEVLKGNDLIKCSVEPNHRVPISHADEHVKKCSLKNEGYDLNEKFLSEPVGDPTSSVYIDDHKKVEILSEAHRGVTYFKQGWNGQDPDPKTADRLLTTFSCDERLALYNYSVSHTQSRPPPPEFDVTCSKQQGNKELSYEELLALERDAKRRRMKYKSVHTQKKNYTEVMREVIEGQMSLYEEWLGGSSKLPNDTSQTEEQSCQSQELHESYREITKTPSDCDGMSTDRKSTPSGRSRSTSRKRDFERSDNKHRQEYRHDSYYRDREHRSKYHFDNKHRREQRHDLYYRDREQTKDHYKNRKYESDHHKYDRHRESYHRSPYKKYSDQSDKRKENNYEHADERLES